MAALRQLVSNGRGDRLPQIPSYPERAEFVTHLALGLAMHSLTAAAAIYDAEI
jgi:hypothetical protein